MANPLKAGFGEIDITPPVGILKIGWKKVIRSDCVLDPLFARAAVFESDGARLAFIQLDTLCVRWTTASQIRRSIEEEYGFPGARIMVAATHNHAGPAVAAVGDVPRDDAYLQTMVEKTVALFGAVLKDLQDAEIGFGHGCEFNVAFNRRVIMRDGTTRTGVNQFRDGKALCFEGPIDPEVAVLAARRPGGGWLGCLVNFACHPTHHGGETALSGGYPGVLASRMKSRGCPVTLFLNGASGNAIFQNPASESAFMTKEAVGAILADDAGRILDSMRFRGQARLDCRARTVRLPFRQVTEAELNGTVKGAQRFIDPQIYEREMPRFLERIRRLGSQPAEVQVLFVDDVAFVGIPAEYFVQHGLRIKEQAYPVHALVIGHANGMIGYVPHREAFRRGGYETTLCDSSRLAPEAGDALADCALELIREGGGES